MHERNLPYLLYQIVHHQQLYIHTTTQLLPSNSFIQSPNVYQTLWEKEIEIMHKFYFQGANILLGKETTSKGLYCRSESSKHQTSLLGEKAKRVWRRARLTPARRCTSKALWRGQHLSWALCNRYDLIMQGGGGERSIPGTERTSKRSRGRRMQGA